MDNTNRNKECEAIDAKLDIVEALCITFICSSCDSKVAANIGNRNSNYKETKPVRFCPFCGARLTNPASLDMNNDPELNDYYLDLSLKDIVGQL